MVIATRLGLGFLMLGALTAGVGGLGLSRMRRLSETTTWIVDDRFSRVRRAEQGVELINENARLALDVLVASTPGQIRAQLADQSRRSAAISELYASFDRRIDSEQERARFVDILRARGVYVSARAAAEALLVDGQRDQALALFEANVLPALGVYIHAWDLLLELEGTLMQDSARDAAEAYARARALTVAATLMALAIGATVAVLVTRQITGPISAIAAAAGGIERGDFLARAKVVRADEIGLLAQAFNRMGDAVVTRDRLAREMKLAQHLQAALLPSAPDVPALEIAASMTAATEVSGDYYDILPVSDGCWIGMGDVAGHGLDAGLFMVMLQSSVASLVRANPDASPRAVVSTVNRILYENLHERLQQGGHATMVVLRVRDDGRVVFAGAHEELLVRRARTGKCEVVDTPGTWVGCVARIDDVTRDSTLQLEQDDVLVLFSDGLTEARNGAGEMFGVERLIAALEAGPASSVEAIRARLTAAVAEWAAAPDDDRSLLVARYRGAPGAVLPA